MLKRIITLALIAACITGLYQLTFDKEKRMFDLSARSAVSIDDVFSWNKDRLDAMRDSAVVDGHDLLQEFLKASVALEVKPIQEKTGGAILRDPQQNDVYRLILYEDDGVYVSSQGNVLLLCYLVSLSVIPPSFEECLADDGMNRELESLESRHPNGPLNQLHTSYQLRITGRYPLTLQELTRVYSGAMVFWSLLHLCESKQNFMRIGVARGQVSDDFSSAFQDAPIRSWIKRRDANPQYWSLAFVPYVFEQNMVRYQLAYYSYLFLVFLLIGLVIVCIVQFFRKDIKRIIREELEREGMSITHAVVYRIFWNHWGYLFYQDAEEKVRAQVRVLVARIAAEQTAAYLAKRAKELWTLLSTMRLSEERRRVLEGLYRTAAQEDYSAHRRLQALDVLEDHFVLLSREETTAPGRRPQEVTAKKEGRGESQRAFLHEQILRACPVEPRLLDSLSTPQLHGFLLAIRVLPSLGQNALSTFLAKGPGQFLRDTAFVNALRFTDADMLRARLGIRHVPEPVSNEAPLVRDPSVLKGKRVLVVGGHRAHRNRRRFVAWTGALGASDVRYVSGSEYAQVRRVCAQMDLVIVIHPVDHAVSYIVQASGVASVSVTHQAQHFFERAIMEHVRQP